MRKLSLLFILWSLFSCKKDIVIHDNVPPPDQTIEDVAISNYVNRVYVTVLGHQPDSVHRAAGFSLLRNNNLSLSSQQQFLDTVFADDAYLPHLSYLARIDLHK